jgi:hypothetical protein
LIEDDDRIADPLDLLQLVGRDDEVDAELGSDAPDQAQHVVALERIEPVRRLVEEHEARIVRDRRGELDSLALAGGHRADRAEALLSEADVPERIVRALDRRLPRDPVKLGQVPHEVCSVSVRRQVVVLGGVPDAGAHLERGRPRILPEHEELAVVSCAQAEDERYERRLAGAVRPEEPRDPVPDVDGEAVEGDRRTESLRQPAGSDDRVPGHSGLEHVRHGPRIVAGRARRRRRGLERRRALP